MKQAQSAANSLRRGGSDGPVVHLAPAAGAGGALEVDVEFEVEKRTLKLKKELQDVTRKFEREAAEYRLSHSQAIRKISEMSTVHAQEQQQQQQRMLELQDSLAQAQKQHEHFEKEVRPFSLITYAAGDWACDWAWQARTLRLTVSESQTNFSHELQALKKTVADLQGTDYAMKCSALEAKQQQTEASHKAELFSLQQQLNKLLESSNTQTRGLPDVAGGCKGGCSGR